jgi:hypothetical protein
MKETSILQIIPARDGWEAVYLTTSYTPDEELSGVPPETISYAIECYALVGSVGDTVVVGMIRDELTADYLTPVDADDPTFVCYNRVEGDPRRLSDEDLEELTRCARKNCASRK